MNPEKITEIYNQEKNRIKNTANYFSQKTRIETDELESEANLAFCKSFNSYNKKKASFRTHLHNNINYALLNFANQNRKPLSLVEINYGKQNFLDRRNNPTIDDDFEPPAREEIQFCIEDNFSPLAAEVVRIIINQELTHLSQLTQILLKKGYKNSTYKNYPSQIQSIYQEIREVINSNKRKKIAMGNTNKEKPRFPYTIKQKYIEYQDKQCCYQMSDHTGFYFFRCPKPTTKKIDNAGLCRRHARSVEIWRKKTCEQN